MLTPPLDAAIMPMFKLKFVVVSAMSLRASLKALRIRPFTPSWLDLNLFEAQRHGVSLPSPDLADILKAACSTCSKTSILLRKSGFPEIDPWA